MSLYEIVDKLLKIAERQPNINYVGEGDIMDINGFPDTKYSLFYITQTRHNLNEDTITYNLILYYVDRIFQDKSNTLSVQSNGIQVLHNIINIFNQENSDVQIEDNLTFNTFTHKFTDYCAGCWLDISITVNNDLGVCGYGF